MDNTLFAVKNFQKRLLFRTANAPIFSISDAKCFSLVCQHDKDCRLVLRMNGNSRFLFFAIRQKQEFGGFSGIPQTLYGSHGKELRFLCVLCGSALEWF